MALIVFLRGVNVGGHRTFRPSILARELSQYDVAITLPPGREWLLRVIASKNRFIFGEYRRHMKTIGYLGQLDKLFGVPATTRNWNTIMAIVRILKDQVKKGH